jgi:hypothetical protein
MADARASAPTNPYAGTGPLHLHRYTEKTPRQALPN